MCYSTTSQGCRGPPPSTPWLLALRPPCGRAKKGARAKGERSMVILVTGPCGVGKTTLGNALRERNFLDVWDVDELLWTRFWAERTKYTSLPALADAVEDARCNFYERKLARVKDQFEDRLLVLLDHAYKDSYLQQAELVLLLDAPLRTLLTRVRSRSPTAPRGMLSMALRTHAYARCLARLHAHDPKWTILRNVVPPPDLAHYILRHAGMTEWNRRLWENVG